MASKGSNGDLDESACCQNAIQCAVEIKNFTSVDLSCHVAVSYGEICFALLGGCEDRWTYLINGDCLTELAEALNDAASKEAVATATCYAKANFSPADISVDAVPDKDSVKVTEVMKFASDVNDKRDSRGKIMLYFSELNKFVPSPVSASVAAGSFGILSELRQVTTLFLKLDSYCRIEHRDLLSLQPFYMGVQELLAATGGYMRQFLVDDKGCVVIALWGVPGTNHPNNCSRALHCGVSISKFCEVIGHACSIGIATGDAYCGTVGSEKIRQDYVAMGDAVNLAARLMGKANGRVLTDELTCTELPLAMSAILSRGEALTLKGRSKPFSPYVYSGAPLPPQFEADKDPENLMVGRKIVELLSEETARLATFQDNARWLLSTIDEKDDYFVDDALIMKAGSMRDGFRKEGSLRECSRKYDSTRESSTKESSTRDSSMRDPAQVRQYLSELYTYVRVIMLVGSAGSGKGNAVRQYKRLADKHHFRFFAFRVNQFDGTVPYSAIHKLFIQLVGTSNFITIDKQRDVVSNLLAECYPDEVLDEVYRKHFPMLKLVLDLEWDYKDTPIDKVTRAYKFIGDQTIQKILSCLLCKEDPAAVVIEDINFCDELSWRELVALMDTKAPVLMLFTGSNTQETMGRRREMSSLRQSSSLESSQTAVSTTAQNLPQVSVKTPTRKQSKFSVYGELGGLADVTKSSSFKQIETSASSVTADVLLTKSKHAYSDIRHHANCVYVKIPLLGGWEVTDILKSVLGIDHVSGSLSSEVLELSGGSIYWCHSIAKYIKIIGIEKFEHELTINEENSMEDFVEDEGKTRFSKRLERHIVFHLDSLSVKLQTVAKYASVIGDEFYISVLSEVIPARVCTSFHDLLQCASALSNEGILDLIDEEQHIYAFQNDLIRKTLREYVLPSDADIIHKLVAQTIEKLFHNQLRLFFASLSYHYAMSPATERGHAFKYTLNAADQQIGNGNFRAGYLYLEYAASFVKYDTEMAILFQVTETALYDSKQQKKIKSSSTTTVTDEDVAYFEKMSVKFRAAISQSNLNGAEILHSNSYQYIANVGSIDSHPSQNSLQLSNLSSMTPSAKKEKKLTSSKSARNAQFLKMPSYSAKHAVHSGRKSRSKCVCLIS